VFLDGIWLKRAWGGEVENVAVLVAIAVGTDGYASMELLPQMIVYHRTFHAEAIY